MAMPGGGYGGYGGPNGFYHQDGNGNHGGGGGGHHAHSNGGGGGGSGMDRAQDDAEEIRHLQARIKEVDLECHRHHIAANEVQSLLEDRAIARLATEREVKELQLQHEEKLKIYQAKAKEINDKCVIGDNRIKELQEAQKKGEEDIIKTRKTLREKIEEAKNRERKRHASSSGVNGGAAASPGARAAAAAARYDGNSANGGSMGRRTQSSTGAPFAPRRASTGTRAGSATAAAPEEDEGGGKRTQGKPGRSNAQPQPFEQMRQNFMEDTLTDFFGL